MATFDIFIEAIRNARRLQPPAHSWHRTSMPDAQPKNPKTSESSAQGPLVLYDGVCGLCSRTVVWLIVHDPQQVLRFAPLQGTTTAALRATYPNIPQNLDSVVLIDGGRMYLRSKVFLYGARYLTRPWRWAYAVRWLPGPLLDLGYRLVAALRYRIWGKIGTSQTCRIPTVADQHRMLP